MKTKLMMVATLLALTLGAMGQTLAERVNVLLVSNRTIDVVGGGATRATPTGDWDTAEMKAATTELLALSKKDLCAVQSGLGFLCLRELATRDEKERATIMDALEATHASADASVAQKAQIAGRLLSRSPKVNLAKAKTLLASMPVNDLGAQAATVVASRFGDTKARDDWFAGAKGKGITQVNYKTWFREQIATIPAASQTLALQQEITGLIKNGSDITKIQPWVDELRYRLYVQKEIAP